MGQHDWAHETRPDVQRGATLGEASLERFRLHCRRELAAIFEEAEVEHDEAWARRLAPPAPRALLTSGLEEPALVILDPVPFEGDDEATVACEGAVVPEVIDVDAEVLERLEPVIYSAVRAALSAERERTREHHGFVRHVDPPRPQRKPSSHFPRPPSRPARRAG